MDTVKVTPKLTIIGGLGTSWNSDPISPKHVFSRLNGSFQSISHDVNRPLNLDILANASSLYPSTYLLQWAPRVALAYQPRVHTLLRVGAGVFAQPPVYASYFGYAENPPTFNQFNAGIFGVGGVGIAPGVPGSAID